MLLAARLAIILCLPFLLAAVLSAQDVKVTQTTIWASKPDAAAFEKIENDRLAAGRQAIDNLVAVKGPRTIENTLVPFDEAVRQNNSAGYFAMLMEQVHPDATFRDHATAMLTKASAAQTAIALNHDVYNALAALDLSQADAATKYYVERQLLEFRLSGVDKDDATRARLKKLNDQATEEQSMFDRNISDGQNMIEADPAELDGLPQDYIDRHKPAANGKIQLTTNYPDALPVFSFAKSGDLRKRMTIAFNTRAYPKNQEVLASLLQTRYEIATLLGYSNWAPRATTSATSSSTWMKLPARSPSANSKCCWRRNGRPTPARKQSGPMSPPIFPNRCGAANTISIRNPCVHIFPSWK
jgi:thimet oligopeptidase